MKMTNPQDLRLQSTFKKLLHKDIKNLLGKDKLIRSVNITPKLNENKTEITTTIIEINYFSHETSN